MANDRRNLCRVVIQKIHRYSCADGALVLALVSSAERYQVFDSESFRELTQTPQYSYGKGWPSQ